MRAFSGARGPGRADASTTRDDSVWLLALAVLLVGAATWSILQFPLNQDIAWPLYIADRLRAGQAAYSDLYEVNPPLVLFLARGVAELSAVLPGISAGRLHAVVVVGLMIVSVMASARAVLREERVALAVFGLLVLLTLPGFEFGQREHVTVALVLPYMLHSRKQPVLSGAMAGVGFAMKPHFLLAWLTIEAVRVRRNGWTSLVRRQNAATAAVWIAYASVVVLLVPEYLTLARLLAPAYLDFGARNLVALASSIRFGAVIVVVLLIREWPDLRAGAAGFAGAALLQGKGWAYHWLPALIIATLVVLMVIDRKLRSRPRLRLAGAGTAVLAGLMLLELSRARMNELDRGPWYLPQMRAVVERTAGPILVLSHAQQAAFPLIYLAGRESASRFPSLWPLGVLYEEVEPLVYREPAAMSRVERFVFDTTVEDLLEQRPGVLIVDRAPAAGVVEGFDYLEYLAQDAEVRAVLQREFAFDSRVGGRYDVYVRRRVSRSRATADDRGTFP